MGMDSAAANGTVILVEDMKKLPLTGPAVTELYAFVEEHDIDQQYLDENYIDPTDFANAVDGDEELAEQLKGLMTAVLDAFRDDTGLELEPFYYNADDGGMYDTFAESSIQWSVCGVYQLTPEAQKIEHLITNAQWTVYG